jgi:transcriptional regulator with XRE-family HTH domain
MNAAERLHAYLERHHLNQAEFAREIGFSYPFVCQLLNGTRRPSLAKAARIELVTGIPARSWAETTDSELASVGSSKTRKR